MDVIALAKVFLLVLMFSPDNHNFTDVPHPSVIIHITGY
jgi:hypothetical protein